jgi:HK97 family phage major capsid protein
MEMTTAQLKGLQDQRMELARQIQELADLDPSQWDDSRQTAWDELNPQYDSIVEEIDGVLKSQQAHEERQQRYSAMADEAKRINPAMRVMTHTSRTEVLEQLESNQDHQRAMAMQGWMRSGSKRPVTAEQRQSAEAVGLDLREGAFDVPMRPYDNVRGYRAWTSGHGTVTRHFDEWSENRVGENLAGTDNVGGYTVPVGFQRELERALLDFGGMRRVARVWSTSGSNPINWPTTNDTSNKAAIVAEATTNEPATAVPFGQVVFNTYKYTSLIQASAELLEDSAFNLAAVFGSMLGERLGRGTAEHYATGDGSGKPTGVTIAAAEGIVAASATAITFDEVIDLIHSVDPAYRRFSSFGMAFHDTTLQALRKLKDSQGRYLWEPSLQVGEPDRIFGVPYVIDQDMPTIADGVNSRIIAIGAMEKFVIRDHAAVRFYRLEERYRELDLTGFSIFFRTDSNIVDAGTEPIKYLALAAA